MSRIIPFSKPPTPLLVMQAQERLIRRYESQLESQSKVLAMLAQHSSDVAAGRGIKAVAGGFSVPWDWQADLPFQCDLNVVEDADERMIVVRLLSPTPRVQPATLETFEREGWHVPDEEKRAEEAAATDPVRAT
jgi:hypothetical protein